MSGDYQGANEISPGSAGWFGPPLKRRAFSLVGVDLLESGRDGLQSKVCAKTIMFARVGVIVESALKRNLSENQIAISMLCNVRLCGSLASD